MKYRCKECNTLFNIVVIVQPNPMIGAVEDCPICQGDLQCEENREEFTELRNFPPTI